MERAYQYKTDDGRNLILCFDATEEIIDGITIKLVGMPLLYDTKNKIYYSTQLTELAITDVAEGAKKRGIQTVEGVTPPAKFRNARYNDYCSQTQFDYSSLEYISIPGLATEFSHDGLLTPVYFNNEVLNKFTQNPKYKINILSSSYGNIWFNDEWHISFGVNARKQIIMWLGDINKLPIKEQQYLLSENIPSSFDIHSDFYDAQIECVWSSGAIENKCLNLRSKISSSVKDKYGSDLYKLPEEIAKTIADLQKPIFWEDRHVAPTIESFNRIFVESLDVDLLKKILISKKIKHADNLRALKLMEKFLVCLSDESQSSAIMLPFFVLYDYRVNVCHLQSLQTVATKTQSINQRLGLDASNVSHEEIYNRLVQKMHKSLEQIDSLISASSN